MAKGALLMLLAEALIVVAWLLYRSIPKRTTDFRVPDWVTFWVSATIGAVGFVTAMYVFLW